MDDFYGYLLLVTIIGFIITAVVNFRISSQIVKNSDKSVEAFNRSIQTYDRIAALRKSR